MPRYPCNLLFLCPGVLLRLLSFGALLALARCDEYPRDPGGTLDRMAGGVMRVGLLMNPPWVDLSGPAPSGVEVALVEALADELGAHVQWVPAGQADVLEALQKRELDIVLGGFTESNPWSAHVAFTRPYYTEPIVVAAAEPMVLPDLDGVPVAVDLGTTEPALVESAGGIPIPAPAPDAEFVAMPSWQLGPDRLAAFTLQEDRHVVALPMGENAWLIRVDRFLRERQAIVWEMLQDAGR